MAKKQKFYVVLKGRQTGIFEHWDECRALVEGFNGARYKSFDNKAAALQAMRLGYFVQDTEAGKQVKLASANFLRQSIAVDAACSGNPGLMEYRGVDNTSGEQLFHAGPFKNGTNNIGEFLALVHGLAYLKKYDSNLPIYSDSRNAIGWLRKKEVKTTLPRNEKTEQIWQLIDRAIAWLRNNTYTNPILKWETEQWGENPADFGRK